jgi:hypothetical protein
MSLLLYLTFLFSVRYILINRNRDYLGCDIVRGKFHQTKFQLHHCFDCLCILLTELFSFQYYQIMTSKNQKIVRQTTSYFTNKCYILYFILRQTDITFLLFYMETGGSTGVSLRNSGKK